MKQGLDWLGLWRELVEDRERGRSEAGEGSDADYWKNAARAYDQRSAKRWAAPDALRELVAAELRPGYSILDIGAGTGAWASFFAGRAASVIAIEPSPDMIAVMRERLSERRIGNVQVVQTTWPTAEVESCDIAFSAHSIYSSPDFSAFAGRMDELARECCFLLLHEGANLIVAHNALVQLGIRPELRMDDSRIARCGLLRWLPRAARGGA